MLGVYAAIEGNWIWNNDAQIDYSKEAKLLCFTEEKLR